MTRSRFPRIRSSSASAVGAVALLVFTPPAAFAQSLPGDLGRDAQRIQEEQAQQSRERAEQFEQSRERPPSGEDVEPESTPAADGGGCAGIREVRLTGITRYKAEDFGADLERVKGSCVKIGAIDDALRAITNRYIGDGYVTSRAFVGPQDLGTGVLVITVIEGRLGAVQGDGAKSYGAGELSSAFPSVRGKILNLRALEQGVDQLARMAKADPSIDIAPGDLAGTSTVLVKRRPLARWLRPSLAFNNEGSASTGRWQGTASLDIDSLFGLADVWSFYYQRGVDDHPLRGNRAYGGFVSLPHGWWTMSISVGASAYNSVLQGNGMSFATRGESWNASATLDRMIYRDARTKLSVSAGLAVIDTKNFIQGIELRTGSYRMVTGRIAARWQKRVGRSVVALSGGYDRGLSILGAHAVDTGPGGATGKFNLIGMDMSLQTPFAIGPTKLTNTVIVRGQWGFDNLFPAQRFSLGGSSTVRGFRDDGISGRSGVALREQVSFGIVDLARNKPALATSVSGFLAYDMGAIRAVSADPFERGLLQSMSTGLRVQGQHVQAEVAVSVPISAPKFVRHAALVSATIRIVL